jgi:hypothetical protein
LHLLIRRVWALQTAAVPMDATTSGTPTIQYHNIPDQPITAIVASSVPAFQRQQRHCFGDSIPGEFPLSANPSIVLHVLTACNLDPQDLAKLEASVLIMYILRMKMFCNVRIDNALDLILNVPVAGNMLLL